MSSLLGHLSYHLFTGYLFIGVARATTVKFMKEEISCHITYDNWIEKTKRVSLVSEVAIAILSYVYPQYFSKFSPPELYFKRFVFHCLISFISYDFHSRIAYKWKAPLRKDQFYEMVNTLLETGDLPEVLRDCRDVLFDQRNKVIRVTSHLMQKGFDRYTIGKMIGAWIKFSKVDQIANDTNLETDVFHLLNTQKTPSYPLPENLRPVLEIYHQSFAPKTSWDKFTETCSMQMSWLESSCLETISVSKFLASSYPPFPLQLVFLGKWARDYSYGSKWKAFRP